MDGRLPGWAQAFVRWLEDPQRIRWHTIFPENQVDVHNLEYDRRHIDHNRALAFYEGRDRIAGKSPFEEAAQLESDVVLRELTEW